MGKTDLVERTRKLIEVPPAFIAEARRYPANVDKALEMIDSVDGAAAMLAHNDGLAHFAARVKADTETVNLIQRGKFKIIDKLGALLESKQGQRNDLEAEGDASETSPSGREKFNKNTLTAYRKVHDHADKIDDYFDSLQEGDGLSEASLTGFIKYVQEATRQEAAGRFVEDRRQLNKELSRPTADSIKNLRNSPGILVGPEWWRPDDSDWMQDELSWSLQKRLDPGGGFVVFRTMGINEAALEAMTLVKSWGLSLWQHQIDVGNGDSAEFVVVGTLGKPDTSRLPTKARRIACPDAGIEALVLSWFRPWAKERGTPNLIAEIFGSEPHEGFLHFPGKPEPV